MIAPSHSRAISPPNDELVRALAVFLFQPPLKGQPIIIRNSIGTTGLQNLIVIWDRWKGVSFPERTEIILAANELLETTVGAHLSLALGRTMDEAIVLGYLPFRVQAILKATDDVDQERILTAMKEEGGTETSSGFQLRFTSLEEAREAFGRLQLKVNGPFWTIIHEVPQTE
jgi:hypothetical protein